MGKNEIDQGPLRRNGARFYFYFLVSRVLILLSRLASQFHRPALLLCDYSFDVFTTRSF